MTLRRAEPTEDGPPPRGLPRWAWWAVILAIFLFVVPLTSPWWSTLLRREIPGAADDEEDGTAPGTGPGEGAEAPVVPGSTLGLTLHLPDPAGSGLRAVEREVPYIRGFVPQIVGAVSELAVATPETPALLPPGTRVLDAAYTPGGTVYIDFSPEIEAARGMGVAEEKLLAQGIVATIIDNFTAVRRVVILVDGKTPRAGHLDLSRPLRLDDPLFAVESDPDAVPSPQPTATATPSSSPRRE